MRACQQQTISTQQKNRNTNTANTTNTTNTTRNGNAEQEEQEEDYLARQSLSHRGAPGLSEPLHELFLLVDGVEIDREHRHALAVVQALQLLRSKGGGGRSRYRRGASRYCITVQY